MSLKQISDRLDQRFRLLTGGSRNAMPRQQTLQATVEWSFSLLHPAERETLLALSVFAGGFDLEAAEAVCTSDSVDAFDILDLLRSLVAKSLVVADRADEAVRYRLLETIRQYSAASLLGSAGEADVLRLRDRHAAHYLGLAERAGPELPGPNQRDWLRRLDGDWDNLRATLEHLAADGRAGESIRLATALDRFSQSRGHAGIGAYLRRAVEQADAGAEVPPALLARALVTMCWIAFNIFARGDASAPRGRAPWARNGR